MIYKQNIKSSIRSNTIISISGFILLNTSLTLLFIYIYSPSQPCNTLTPTELQAIYDKLIYICTFAVQVQGNTKAFPNDWLMLYRWGKRNKKSAGDQKTAQGYKIDYVTVGGRTSTIVPELQKKRESGGALVSKGVRKQKKEKKQDVKKEEAEEVKIEEEIEKDSVTVVRRKSTRIKRQFAEDEAEEKPVPKKRQNVQKRWLVTIGVLCNIAIQNKNILQVFFVCYPQIYIYIVWRKSCFFYYQNQNRISIGMWIWLCDFYG